MKASNIPTKFPIPFGASASAPDIRSIPQASQIGIQAGAASLTDGFPPACFIPVGAGGTPPFGADFNGVLNTSTAWDRWFSAGGPIIWDSAFSSSIGGYPQGSFVESSVTPGVYWSCTIDDNLSNPDSGGAGWLLYNASGAVTMKYVNGAWITYKPDNSVLLTPGSTTNGLQETINYAIQNGYHLDVFGQGAKRVSRQTGTLNSNTIITNLNTAALSTGLFVTGPGIPVNTTITSIDSSTQIHISNSATLSSSQTLSFSNNPIFIACTTAIIIGPAEQWSCCFYNVNITFSPAVSGAGITFDSMIICDFAFYGGQIVYQGSTYAVSWSPTNPVPLDGVTTIGGSRFHISNVAAPSALGGATGIWAFNCSNGGILNNWFSSVELNGAGAPGSAATVGIGISVFGPTASTGFEQNIFDIAEIHKVINAGVQIGTNTTHADVLRQNIWRIGGIHPTGASSVGFDSFGPNDIISIGGITTEEGALLNGVVFQSSAVGNQISVGAVIGNSGAALVEASPGTNYCYGPALRGGSSLGATKGYTIAADGTITQYINNANGTTGGTTTTFALPFSTLLSVTASSSTTSVGFVVAGTTTGVTITTASGSGVFFVMAIGK